MRHTVSPVVGRVLQPAMIKAMFAPAAVTERFDREFPKAMMLRPLQLRGSAEDAALKYAAEGSKACAGKVEVRPFQDDAG